MGIPDKNGEMVLLLHQKKDYRKLDEDPSPGDPNTKSTTDMTRLGLIRVVLASLAACVGCLVIGMSIGYPSPAIPDLNANPNPFHVTNEEQTWHGSVPYMSAVLGSLVSATLADQWGRRTTLMLTPIVSVAGWMITIASCNADMFIVGNLLVGFSNPLLMIAINVYIAEISPPNIRGTLTSLIRTTLNVGTLVVYLAGTYLHWNWLAILCLLPPVLLTILMMLLPESPRWLLMHNRPLEATEVTLWLRGRCDSSESVSKRDLRLKDHESMNSIDRQPGWRNYFRQPMLKNLLISQTIFLFTALSSVVVVRTYTVTIFQWSESHIDSYTQTIVVGASFVMGCLASNLLIGRLAQRVLLMASFVVMTVGWLALGAFFLSVKVDKHFTLNWFSWLALVSMMIIVFGSCLSSMTLPFLVTNELFPTNARGFACSMGEVNFNVVTVVINKTFLHLGVLIGVHSTFWLYASFCVAGAVYIYFCVPETKGTDFDELDSRRVLLTKS